MNDIKQTINERLTKADASPSNITLREVDVKALKILFNEFFYTSGLSTVKWNLGTTQWGPVREMFKGLGKELGLEDHQIKYLCDPKD